MSENQSPHKDRTALYIAIVGATATIIAALIAVSPNWFNRNSGTTTIVITATPEATGVAQATAVPTHTPIPSTIAPTNTVAPTATAISPTPNNSTSLLLVNNLPRQMDFYADGVKTTSIDSGTYQVLPVPIGAHEFKQCVFGTDNCFAKTARLSRVIDYWEMFDTLSAGELQTTLTLLVLNQSAAPQDIYMDGIFAKRVDANNFIALTGPGGLHTLQACAAGETPASGKCGERYPLQLGKKIEIFKILGESS